MFSHQSVSDAYQGNLIENWEEDLLANVFSSNPNIPSSCDTSFQTQVSDTQTAKVVSEQNDVTIVQGHQMQVSAAYQNLETSTLLSPTWEDSTFEISQNCTNTSTYFSTFNPSSQFEDIASHQISMRTSLNVGTQNVSEQNRNRTTHSARISLVPAENGNLKAIVKRKRKRTVFTTEQLELLEEVFSKKPYVTRDERQLLVKKLQVNDKSIKIWFQNRRLKNKKGDDQNEGMQDDSNSKIFDRLQTVESEIIKRTDEFGYVTLDDKFVNDLVNVIDDYFTSNTSPVATTKDTDNSPIYEPISPASTSDYSCEENAPSWQYYEPNESVQQMMDIESVITR